MSSTEFAVVRYDAEHKQRTRERVLKEAGRAIRAEGPQRIGVAGVMARAGLTHGGFYAHFASKEAFVADAIAASFEDARRNVERRTAGLEPEAALKAYIETYLSEAHRDGRERGCPVAALAADLPRLDDQARRRFAEGVEALIGRLGELMAEAGRPEALAGSVVAEMTGALALARALPDPDKSRAILDGSRRALFVRLNLEDAR